MNFKYNLKDKLHFNLELELENLNIKSVLIVFANYIINNVILNLVFTFLKHKKRDQAESLVYKNGGYDET